MFYKKLNWTLMLILLPILILGLTACGGQSENEAPPATTAGERTVEGTEADAPAKTGDAAEGVEVREATTVMAATKMIDLHKLPLPDEAELMGDPEPGSLRYQAPIEVAAAVDLYRSALTDQGWQEDVEAGLVDKASASLFFAKEDFKLSVSASDMGEGKTMVSLTNHGNIDLRALPQIADAEDVYYFPSTLSYFSPTDVPGVADFTRRELAAQGWHEYTRPNTAMADDPERQSFSLIQNGLELSVSVGVAPAQGGKTAVQYSVSLLPLDLPLPADASDLEFEKFLLNLSLSYTTPADFETLFDYYTQEMTALGWVVIDSIGMMTPERATLFFGNENVPPHTLVLDLVPSDGQTRATLRDYEVDELTELNSPGDGNFGENTGEGAAADSIPTEIKANVGDTIELGDLSFTVTEVTSPAESTYEPYEGHKFLDIVFTIENRHSSDTLSAFSLLWLSINDSDGNGYGYDGMGFTAIDDPDDSYGSHNGSVAPDEQARGKITFQIPVDAKELVFVVDAPELGDTKAFVALPETEAPQLADSSGGEMPAFLTPSEAQDVVYDADYGEITYTSPSDIETLVEFYREMLSAEGWEEDAFLSIVEETTGVVSFDRGSDSLFITMFKDPISGQTGVSVDVSGASALTEGITTSSDSTQTDTSGPLTAAEDNYGDFPIPANYTGYSADSSEFYQYLETGSPSDLPTVLEFYLTELTALGWQPVSDTTVATDTAAKTVTFEGPDGELVLELQAGTGETQIIITAKNKAAAEAAGLLPPAGQVRIALASFAEEEVTLTIADQTIVLPPGAAENEPDPDFMLDLSPGSLTYTLTDTSGNVIETDIIEVDADETWGLIAGPGGMLPFQLY